MVQVVELALQRRDVRGHVLVFLRVLEPIAAVRCIHALEIEIAAPLARDLTIAFYLTALALFS